MNTTSKGFWKSSHKITYILVAIKFGVSPKYVYKIAHQLEYNSKRDLEILRELAKRGVVHHSRRHHD